MPTALVLGAGLSGLSCAYALTQKGFDITVMESASHVGGVIHSIQQDGFLIEAGAQSCLLQNPQAIQLIEELGLKNDLLYVQDTAQKYFIAKNKEIFVLPKNLKNLSASPLLSKLTKAHILKKIAFGGGSPDRPDETLHEFVKRHFNEEVLHVLAQPLASSICAGNAKELVVRDAFPLLLEAEAKGNGSIVRGFEALKETMKASEGLGLASFKDGLSSLPSALAKHLRQAPLLNVSIEALEGPPWKLRYTHNQYSQSESYDLLVLAVPAHRIASLPLPLPIADHLAPLDTITHPKLAMVSLGYRSEDLRCDLEGMGVLFAKPDYRIASSIFFNSSLFAHRAPKGKVLLTVLLGGALNPDIPDDSPTLIARAQEVLAIYLNIEADPLTNHVSLWKHSIPQYTRQRASVIKALYPLPWENLKLTGNYLNGFFLEDELLAGHRLLKELKLS